MLTKNKTHSYLEQTKELYGNVLYYEKANRTAQPKDPLVDSKNQNAKILNDYEVSICMCQKVTWVNLGSTLFSEAEIQGLN